jgi:menaquinone-dependent protoporphyrinogen IX oxidase
VRGTVLRVLVTAACHHGSTHEIADALARAITQSGAGGDSDVVVSSVPAEQRPDPSTFDAVVLHSAVYAGRWLEGRSRVTSSAACLPVTRSATQHSLRP